MFDAQLPGILGSMQPKNPQVSGNDQTPVPDQNTPVNDAPAPQSGDYIQADQQPTAPTTVTSEAESVTQLPPEAPKPKVSAEDEPKPKKEGGVLSLFVTIIIALVLVQIINLFLLQSYRVYGSSMHSTLETNDRLIISKLGKTASDVTRKDYQPKRGDIIVFQSPIDDNLQLIKRVIGLPGERVVVKGGVITVYNQEYPDGFNPDDAPYGKDLPRTSGNVDIRVPANHIFVSGDNREGSNSLDSRNELGTVPEENIIGKLVLRIWPINEAKFF